MSMQIQPYKNNAFNRIYNLLFCDDLDLFRQSIDGNVSYPWNILFADVPDQTALAAIIADPQTESRIKLLAYQLLEKVSESNLLAVIIEVGLDDGLDVLAAYEDGTARYINHTEKLIVWETKTTRSQSLIEELFSTSATVVANIGPWEKERLAPPGLGELRLSFLVSNKIYFGNGPFNLLQQDPMASPVIDAATQLMQFLVEQKIGEPAGK